MASDNGLWPPDTRCFVAQQAVEDDLLNCTASNYTVTQGMISFLNLTADVGPYKQAYCLKAPSDDSCPFGYCPNPDVSGPLVRIASYITNICISVLMFYSPHSAEEAFWSQVLSIYSLLITCGISIIQASLTQFHAAIVTIITGSPLSVYLFIYSIVSFWYKKHRLNGIVGEGHLFVRLLILAAGALWICLLVYILVPSNLSHFAQESCVAANTFVSWLYLIPFMIIGDSSAGVPWLTALVFGTVGLVVVSWIVAIILQRKSIWRSGERWSPRFGRTWSTIGRNYSFIHFMSIVLIPNIYWISIVEFGCLVAANDQEFSLSFGQVLAMFVALPPLLSTLRLAPRLAKWFINLTWVRTITGRRRGGEKHGGDTLNLAVLPVGNDGEGGWRGITSGEDYGSVFKEHKDVPVDKYTPVVQVS
ncbi:unnamed protein product [Somion occarium]|uniref:Uncharacterized protein n=1 Tax=Somion occarium TaxID=3059160 RepID=A0ABP1DP48_9APHY